MQRISIYSDCSSSFFNSSRAALGSSQKPVILSQSCSHLTILSSLHFPQCQSLRKMQQLLTEERRRIYQATQQKSSTKSLCSRLLIESYIPDDKRPQWRSLWCPHHLSANTDDINNNHVTRTHSTFGDRAFAAAGPGLWNSLPPHLRDSDLPYSRFRRSLKTFCSDSGATAQSELF